MGANGLIFVAGQGPLDPTTGTVPVGIEAQTRQVLRNVGSILEAAGATFDDVVKVTAHLADLRDFETFDHVYGKVFHEPYPVRTTVGSQLSTILVEVDVIANGTPTRSSERTARPEGTRHPERMVG